MDSINVKSYEEKDGWLMNVSVQTKSGSTQHEVTLGKELFTRLNKKSVISAEEFVKKSFEFLLEKESNQMILKKFDVSVIGKYFPDYERVISGEG